MFSTRVVRLALVAFALGIGACGLASALAELGSLARPPFPQDLAQVTVTPDPIPSSLQSFFPFRTDLESNHALALALQKVQSTKSAKSKLPGRADEPFVERRLERILSTSPYDAELWLALAMLENNNGSNSLARNGALKMAYFTAPSATHLMPLRLVVTTSSDALADPDIRELARGDVLVMLSQKNVPISAYVQASRLGKEFLKETIQSVDSSLVVKLPR
ncbi:hypothetical protein C2U70_27135 [Bradyrhizobium guangdongense]|nr:hypothetical protein C2U70_27135 [Bradyrhizobium guangdongense]